MNALLALMVSVLAAMPLGPSPAAGANMSMRRTAAAEKMKLLLMTHEQEAVEGEAVSLYAFWKNLSTDDIALVPQGGRRLSIASQTNPRGRMYPLTLVSFVTPTLNDVVRLPPGRMIGFQLPTVKFSARGTYRLYVTMQNRGVDGIEASRAWRGTLKSNVLTIRIRRKG